jgi:nucleoside-diphosphate-sugar epimerase
MKKILITGNKGFVGRHLKQYYASYGTEFTLIDINGGEDARAFFKRNDTQFDMVFHCAALVGGRLFIENAPLSVALDLSIDAEFFNWVIRTRPKAVAYFSSSAAYPIELQTLNSGHKLKETDIDLNNIKNPDYTYGWAKLTGEWNQCKSIPPVQWIRLRSRPNLPIPFIYFAWQDARKPISYLGQWSASARLDSH